MWIIIGGIIGGLVIVAVVLFGIFAWAKNTLWQPMDGPGMEYDFASYELVYPYESNAFQYGSWLGKSLTELNLDSSLVDLTGKSMPCIPNVSGEILGREISGEMFLGEMGEDYMVHTIDITCHIPYEECLEAMKKYFGEAIQEGYEPYTEVNDGALTWAKFTIESGVIELSRGSNEEFITLRFFTE